MAQAEHKRSARYGLDVYTMMEIGVALGLALLLAFFMRRAFLIPASVPIYYLSYRRGWKVGVFAGFLFALATMNLAFANLPHPVVFIESPLEYMVVGLAGLWPMRPGKSFDFRAFFAELGQGGWPAAWKNHRADFLNWLYDARGLAITSVLRFLVVILGSAVYYSYYLKLAYVQAIVPAMIMEARFAVPGLIFFAVVIPILVKYRMHFRSRGAP